MAEKAVLALEEAVQECRYRTPRRSLAVRFALAFLWSQAGAGGAGLAGKGGREPFERFWRALGREDLWRFSSADQALSEICRAAGVRRDEEAGMEIWRRRYAEEQAGR